MTAPLPSPDLVRWEVPFAEERWPSVSVLSEEYGETVLIVVASRGFGYGMYPKYLVRFRNVVMLLHYEETCAIDRGFQSLTRSHPALSAYRWISSPWLNHYRILEDIIFNKSDKLHHYLIFDADTIVEVIALGEPSLERIDSKRTIEFTLEI